MNNSALFQGAIMAFVGFFLGVVTVGMGLTLLINHWIGFIFGATIISIIGFIYGYGECIKKQEKEEIRKYSLKRAEA